MADPLSAVPAGDRPVARAALDRLASAPADIREHSLRMITIAQTLVAGHPVDGAMLVTACAVHDLGLLTDWKRRWPGLRFPDRSAAVFAELAERYGIEAGRSEPWCRAVAGHLRPPASTGEPYEAGLIRRAAWLDGAHIGSRSDRAAVRGLGLSRPMLESALLLLRIGTTVVRDLAR